MLKIKDNVDLKELEKFGFIEGVDDCCHPALIKDLGYADYIAVYEDKQILVDVEGSLFQEEKVKEIQDLIQADLVEKVEVENE